jgi:hypothetical protein
LPVAHGLRLFWRLALKRTVRVFLEHLKRWDTFEAGDLAL